MKMDFRLAVCSLGLLLVPTMAAAERCGELAALALPEGSITLASAQPAGTLTGLDAKPLENLPAFCRVAATLRPTPDSKIRIEVWLPASGWNGRFKGTGNGGFAGGIGYGSLAGALRAGYAVATTDMGTSVAAGETADALVGHPERWWDWGERSTHAMTVAAKRILEAYYGKPADHSYFVGCSTGGQQALVEAQRYPDDYDGIVAGAPANFRTHLHIGFIWDERAAEDEPGSRLPQAKFALLSRTVLAACAPQKAVATDGFLSDPVACPWQPQTLLCKAGDAPDCLTAAQVRLVEKLYDGPRDPVTHAAIYPGLTRGSELDFNSMMPVGGSPKMDSLFKWVFGMQWNWRTFDFHRDVAPVDKRLAAGVNAVSPDLSLFKAHGHKLLYYHGWADVLVPSLESLDYRRSVEAAQMPEAARHKHSAAEETDSFYRLFMVPGMAHCGGGPGLSGVDPLPALVDWVENGAAPEQLTAQRTENGSVVMTRPVCRYPQSAIYNGAGDAHLAASFHCGALSGKSEQ
ncbi:MAG: tannase/feruloyl esterase family alpha/beta hydrolase [Terracidiphilus sp.]|nr:tannase/feruloyl esterase family alpha/beta hydrolase [Terracidiphilus sp.]